MKTTDFEYDLPEDYIAQQPVEPRDASRLLVLDRATGSIEHSLFRDIGDYLNPNDLVVINETRVIPARLFGRKIPGGGKVEVLLLRKIDLYSWEVIVGGQGLIPGKFIQIDDGPQAEVIAAQNGAQRLIRFSEPIEPLLARIGHVPLPPYIHEPLHDPERYQTVYAQAPGSAAAPTAGLHFTPQLIAKLKQHGVNFARVTLHVGLDTFAPVNEANPQDHAIHTEWCLLDTNAVRAIRKARQSSGRIIAVGTTSVRTIESAAQSASLMEIVIPFEGRTNLFILPGYQYRAVDALITNFHLPRSTLLMLVSAFAGREMILSVYEEAKRHRYRFYSFGDAMLIL